MDSIYFEKQEGQLCAQHCLNNLLQGPYFTAVDLAGFAQDLDEAEKATMAEGDLTPSRLHHLMQQPSTNMDDSGFFSVQVISKALRVWNLESVPLSSPAMKQTMEDPTCQMAFICNHDYHWLTVRKLGRQWFNLDSLLRKPKLVSDTYLSLFLTQLQMEGYSIFVVEGLLPPCEADQLLTLVPVEPEPTTASPTPGGQPSCADCPSKRGRTSEVDDEDESFALDLATAMSASLVTTTVTSQEPEGTVAARPCGLREEEEKEEPDLELPTASQDDSKKPEDSTRLPPGEGSSAPSEPAKPLSDELPPDEGSSASSEPAKPLSDEGLPPGEGSSAPSEPAKPLSDELPPDEGSSASSEPAKPLSDEGLPPGKGSSASSEPAKPLSDEELRQKRLLHLGEL